MKTIARVTSALLAGGAVLSALSSARAQDRAPAPVAPGAATASSAAAPTAPTPPTAPATSVAPASPPVATPVAPGAVSGIAPPVEGGGAAQAGREQPPSPAAPHTEYEGAPPTREQGDQWPPEPAEGDAAKAYPRLHPFASIVGGVKYDNPIQGPGLNAADRVSTLMLADFGLRGSLTSWISFESELMANGGASLHGTSVFEGQAALQIRKQVIHLARNWWSVEVGRVIDEASVDYFSNHVADVFLEDDATRDALLFDGFNLGNGIRGTAEILPGLRLGLSANAGNPTSSSAILAFGGSFPPYSAIFYQAASATRTNISGYPDDEFQSYIVTPSILFKHKFVEAKGAFQYFLVNPGASDGSKPVLHGYNARFNVAAHINDDMFMPYFNLSYGQNDTIDLTNTNVLSGDKYTGIGIGGGLDFNYQKKFGNYNGVGVQFVQDASQVGSTGVISQNRYYNVGTTYWLAPMLALGLRYAQYTLDQLNQPPGLANTPQAGQRSVLLTLRLIL